MIKKQSGFTLLEVIVVFTLLAMIMAMIFSGIDSGRRMVTKGEAKITAINEIRVIQNIIRHQVSRAMPIAIDMSDEGEMIKFIGEPRRIVYVSQMPGYLGSGGPHIQELQLVDERDGMVLQYRHGLVSNYDEEDEFSPFEESEPMVLLENISEGAFEFIELDEEREPTDWLAEMEKGVDLPLMVRLDLTMNENAKQSWPILQMALRMDGGRFSARRPSILNRFQRLQPGESQ
jgi:general secretion pathway protein J